MFSFLIFQIKFLFCKKQRELIQGPVKSLESMTNVEMYSFFVNLLPECFEIQNGDKKTAEMFTNRKLQWTKLVMNIICYYFHETVFRNDKISALIPCVVVFFFVIFLF